MPAGGPLSERALILAPFGRDAQVASLILESAGYVSFTCLSLEALAHELVRGAGFALVALGALNSSELTHLSDALKKQEPWSDFPFLVFAMHGQGLDRRLIP